MSFTTIYSTFRLLYASFTIEVFPDGVDGSSLLALLTFYFADAS